MGSCQRRGRKPLRICLSTELPYPHTSPGLDRDDCTDSLRDIPWQGVTGTEGAQHCWHGKQQADQSFCRKRAEQAKQWKNDGDWLLSSSWCSSLLIMIVSIVGFVYADRYDSCTESNAGDGAYWQVWISRRLDASESCSVCLLMMCGWIRLDGARYGCIKVLYRLCCRSARTMVAYMLMVMSFSCIMLRLQCDRGKREIPRIQRHQCTMIAFLS